MRKEKGSRRRRRDKPRQRGLSRKYKYMPGDGQSRPRAYKCLKEGNAFGGANGPVRDVERRAKKDAKNDNIKRDMTRRGGMD